MIDDGDPFPNDLDNDPNDELHVPGLNLPSESEAAFVAMEQVRNEVAQWALNYAPDLAYTTGHELGHQFELGHNSELDANGHPTNLMWAPSQESQEALADNVASQWIESDIITIRQTTSP